MCNTEVECEGAFPVVANPAIGETLRPTLVAMSALSLPHSRLFNIQSLQSVSSPQPPLTDGTHQSLSHSPRSTIISGTSWQLGQIDCGTSTGIAPAVAVAVTRGARGCEGGSLKSGCGGSADE